MQTTIEELLAAAETDLAQKVRQRDELNVAIIQAQQQVGALRSLTYRNSLALTLRNEGQALVGLTEAIRSILRLRNIPMKAGEIKGSLDLIGFNFGGISNPSAAVHNTVKRMAETLEICVDESKAYSMPSWDASMRAALARNPKESVRPTQRLGTHKLTGKK
jgi:hypothetical protein